MTISSNIEIPDQVVSLRVFGSVARGDADSRSDVDILAVLRNNHMPSDNKLNSLIGKLYGRKGNISWYSYKRITELYQQGHLFAWHIFQESKNLLVVQEDDVIEQLGRPSKYSSAQEDIASLTNILTSVKNEIIKCPRNAIYEAGLIYVCARNIALPASSFSNTKLDFSRYSPYNLDVESCTFPIPRRDYDMLIQARHSSMRGGTPPQVKVGDILDQQRDVIKWARRIKSYAKDGNHDSKNCPQSI